MGQTESFVDAVWYMWIMEDNVETKRFRPQCNCSANQI